MPLIQFSSYCPSPQLWKRDVSSTAYVTNLWRFSESQTNFSHLVSLKAAPSGARSHLRRRMCNHPRCQNITPS